MANKASSGRSGFLRVGVPCAAPGSPLGGDGKLGTISAALALSSRNLSNSVKKKEKEKKGGIRLLDVQSGRNAVGGVAVFCCRAETRGRTTGSLKTPAGPHKYKIELKQSGN
ncbi:hypothetical protein EYF80_034885 [Liparis tanakae]|uniref:Uncharacterized protein n=1 Tax=Liparis tanakae TaxID=230148 RepID=A0A4Z2GNZ2_9TELE|nr:hypothetical protein EYF80_034885 [Liparis tanakae]